MDFGLVNISSQGTVILLLVLCARDTEASKPQRTVGAGAGPLKTSGTMVPTSLSDSETFNAVDARESQRVSKPDRTTTPPLVPVRTLKGSNMAAKVEGSHIYGKRTQMQAHGSPGTTLTEMASILGPNETVSLPARREATRTSQRTSWHARVPSQESKMALALAKPNTNKTIQATRRVFTATKPLEESTKPLKEACTQAHCTRAPSIPRNPSRVPAAASSPHRPVSMVTRNQRRDSDSYEQTHQSGSEGNVLHKQENGFTEPGRAARRDVANGGQTASGDPGRARAQAGPGRSRLPVNKLPAAPAPAASRSSSEHSPALSSDALESTRPVGMATGASKSKTFTQRKASESERKKEAKVNFSAMGLGLQPEKRQALATPGISMPTTGVSTRPARSGSLQDAPFAGAMTSNAVPTSKYTTASPGQSGPRRTLPPYARGHPRTSFRTATTVSKEGTPKLLSTVIPSGPSGIPGLVGQSQRQSAGAPRDPLSVTPKSILGRVPGNLSLVSKRDSASLPTWELVTTDYQQAAELTAQSKKPQPVILTPAKQSSKQQTTSIGSSHLPPQSTPESYSLQQLATWSIHLSQMLTTQANQKMSGQITSRYNFVPEKNTLVNQMPPVLATEADRSSSDRPTLAHQSPQEVLTLANQRPAKLTISAYHKQRELTTPASQIYPEIVPDPTILGDSPVTKRFTLLDTTLSDPSKLAFSTLPTPKTKKRSNHTLTKPNAATKLPLPAKLPLADHTLQDLVKPASELPSITFIQESHYFKKLTTPAHPSTQQAILAQEVSTPTDSSLPELMTSLTYSLPEVTPPKNFTVHDSKVAEQTPPDLTPPTTHFPAELNTPTIHYLLEQIKTERNPLEKLAISPDQTALENLFTAQSTLDLSPLENKRLTGPLIPSNTAVNELNRSQDRSFPESVTHAELSTRFPQGINTVESHIIPNQNPLTANPPEEISVTENHTQSYQRNHLRQQIAMQTLPTYLPFSDWTAPISRSPQKQTTHKKGSLLEITTPSWYRTREKHFNPNITPSEQMITVDHFLKELTTPAYHIPLGLFTSSTSPAKEPTTPAGHTRSDRTTTEIHTLPELTTPTHHSTTELYTTVDRAASEITAPDDTPPELYTLACTTASELTTEGHTASELTTESHTASELTTEGHTASELTTEGHTTSEPTTEGHTASEPTTEESHATSELTTHMVYNITELTTTVGKTAVRSTTPTSVTSKLPTPVDHTTSELTALVDHSALRPTTPVRDTTSKLSKLTTSVPHTAMKLTTPGGHTTFEPTTPIGQTTSKITTPADRNTSTVITLVALTTLKATIAAFSQTSQLTISVNKTPSYFTTPVFHPQSTVQNVNGSENSHLFTEKQPAFLTPYNEHRGRTPEESSSWNATSIGTISRTQTSKAFSSSQTSVSDPTNGTKVQEANTWQGSTGHAGGPDLVAMTSVWPSTVSGQTEVTRLTGQVSPRYTPSAGHTEDSQEESNSQYASPTFPSGEAEATGSWHTQSPHAKGSSDVSNESSWQSVTSPTAEPPGKTLNVPEIFINTVKNGTSSTGIFIHGETPTVPTSGGAQSGMTYFEVTTNSIRMKSTIIHHQFPTTSPATVHTTHRTSLSTSHHSTSRGVPERPGRIFIVEDQPPILKASEGDVAFQLALDMVYIRNLERVDSLQRQDLVHAFQETVSPFYKSVPGFMRLEVLGFREGSVILDYIAVFNLESLNLLMMEQPERLLNLSRLPLAIASGLWVAGHRVMGISVTERWTDLCGKAYSCLAGFVCAHARHGNVTCTSLCHDGFCKNEGICTHRRGQEPMCQCPVGSDYWFMGVRCDYRMTQQALLGISCGVILSLVLCISAIAYLAMRRFKALLVETKINQTKSSYRRFSRFDDISTRYWSQSQSQSQSWLGASISSLDNLAFSQSEEVLHLHAMESRRGSSPEDADPAGTCSPRSTPHRRPECRPGFHSDWETSCSSFNDPMVDSGKASAISVSSWPMEPIQWTPFPILHQLTAHSPESRKKIQRSIKTKYLIEIRKHKLWACFTHPKV